jgi:triosephosphate isomerase
MKPIILVNFKTYKQATGKNAVKVAKICDSISKKNRIKVMVAVQVADIFPVSRKVKIPVLAQHVDYFEQDRHTGAILPEDIKQEGASGTLLNHSEHKLKFGILKKTIMRCKENKLVVVACAASVNEAKRIAKLEPEYIMFEDPKLVATGRSITKIKPISVKNFANMLKRIKSKSIPLCGAGISSKQDIELALKLGCKGIGVSSAVIKAKNPRKGLLRLIESRR